MQQFRNLLTIIVTNLKYIIANKLAMIILTIFTLCFLLVSGALSKELDSTSSIPVGILDLDQSEMSKGVVERLKSMDGFTIYEWSQEELESGLKNERILAYFIIREDFESEIKNDSSKNVVKMCYLKDYKYISIASDIFAKAMMYNVILYHGNTLYTKISNEQGMVSMSEYIAYVNQLKLDAEYEFSFDFEYYKMEGSGKVTTNETKNTLISNQLFIGLVTIFASFIIMFLVMCLRKSTAIVTRMKTTLIPCWIIEAGNLCTVLLLELVLATLFSIYMCKILHMGVGDHILAIFVQLYFVLIAFTVLFYTLSKCLRSEIVYQFIGISIILSFGGLSILQAMGQLKLEIVVEFAKNIPNYWFISGITDIILAGSTPMNLIAIAWIGILFVVYCAITIMKYRYIAR